MAGQIVDLDRSGAVVLMEVIDRKAALWLQDAAFPLRREHSAGASRGRVAWACVQIRPLFSFDHSG